MTASVLGWVGRLRPPAGTDAELLRAFARHRDADAFAGLVRRHGPRVWATCRRLAGAPHAADDAFQAVFLVLARKAPKLTSHPSLGGWLHAVAVNVSRRARAAAGRRKGVAAVDAAAPAPPDPPDERALAALDEEIERLPAKLRDAVALCELDGLSRREAADRLGVPEGTLSSRLAAARKRLGERLRERGFGPEVLALPVAAVPAGLAEAAAGLGAGAVPAPAVLALAGGVMRAMLLKAVAVGAVLGGLTLAGGRAHEEPPAKPPAAVAGRPPETILLDCVGESKLLTLDGAVTTVATGFAHPHRSPDGRLLVRGQYQSVQRDGRWVPHANQLVLTRIDGTGGPVEVSFPPPLDEPSAMHLPAAFWHPDGAAVTVTFRHQTKPGDRRVYRLDVPKRVITRLPDDAPAGDPSPDGKAVCVLLPHRPPRPGVVEHIPFRLTLVSPAAADRVVTPADRDVLADGRFSPDGTRLLYRDGPLDSRFRPLGDDRPRPDRLCVLHLATGAVTVVTDATQAPPARPGSTRQVGGFCWSPDGRRVALNWEELRAYNAPELPPEPGEVWVYDVDRRTGRSIRTGRDERAVVVDWR